MKFRKHLFKVAILSSVFALGTGLIVVNNASYKEVDATQYIGDYAPYTYSGNYYSTIDFDATGGMNGALRQSLSTLIYPSGFYKYSGGGEGTLSEVLQEADEDPTNPNNMVTYYTRDSIAKTAATVNCSVVWNREHVWCQSLSNGNWGTSQGGTDILHLRPTYASPNSTRNNHKYGDADGGAAKSYEGKLYGWLKDDYFEPLDCVKGDAARIIMYVWTTYNNSSKPLSIPNVFKDYDTLLRWHTLDKPDAIEGNRNDYSEQVSKQKNRNPFVDHPELAWKIFGDMASESVKNSCMATYPVGGSTPIQPTGIALNKTTTSVEIGKTVQLRATLEPSGATGTVTWSTNNSNIATVDSNGLVTGQGIGSTSITATVGSYSASCTVTVSEAVNNYGTLQNPLNVEDALEVLYAAGDNMTAEKIYVKGTVSSSKYNTKYSNFDYVWLQSVDGELEQALQLYHVNLDSSITDDYTAQDALKGCEVIAYGYGKKYNSIYELAPKNSDYPSILSVTQPTGSVLKLDKTEVEIVPGSTETLVPTLIPSDNTVTYTWESSDEGVVALKNNGTVIGINIGAAIITATASNGAKAECLVKVKRIKGTTTFNKVDSIASGDIVYLTAESASVQYDGPSSTSTIYGLGADYETTPDVDGIAFDVETGHASGSFAFKLKSGDTAGEYLNWTTGNSLSTSATLSDNTSWKVTFDANGNATIKNAADDARVIWWNVSSPRFACYTNKTAGSSYYSTQLWKTTQNAADPSEYLAYSSIIQAVTADETCGEETVDSLTFKDIGLTNGAAVPSIDFGNVYFFAELETGGHNAPRYYNDGQAVRLYTKNSIVIGSDNANISRIEFTFNQNYETGLELAADNGVLNGNVWTGNSAYVSFHTTIGSGEQIRISKIDVTHHGEVSVSNIALRFGCSIPKANWDALAEDHTISNYGVMFVKFSTLSSYPESTVADAYKNGRALAKVYANTSAAPHQVGNNYMFTAGINITNTDNCQTTYCAAPFVVVDDEYYFLPQINNTASNVVTSSNNDLSPAAIQIIASYGL